jgi:GNAT superfamily N-acetyltransferase
MNDLMFSTYNHHPPEACALVDAGLGQANEAAAPLHEVQSLACFARATPGGPIIGGAVGRWWGRCCELQQLWVEPAHRRRGMGAQLIKRFEAHALQQGCTVVYLETFSFQAPSLYRSQGYVVEIERTGFPHGISKFHMVKHVSGSAATPRPDTP